MSLDKAIVSGKEQRKPRRRAARWDPACRPNHACSWCRSNRTIREQREKARTDLTQGILDLEAELEDFEDGIWSESPQIHFWFPHPAAPPFGLRFV